MSTIPFYLPGMLLADIVGRRREAASAWTTITSDDDPIVLRVALLEARVSPRV